VKAHAHGLSGALVWLGGALVVERAGYRLDAAAVIGGVAVATGMAVAPDLDVQGTAARALGWPTRLVAYVISWLTEHRGMTHWAVTGVVLAALVSATATLRWSIDGFVAPWVAAGVLTLGYAWCQAAAVADDRPRRRIGVLTRWMVSLAAAAATLRMDSVLLWLGPAVLAGWWAHLVGDFCTSDRWPVLAPFTFREFGGWRLIRPTPRGRRVTRTERVIESLLFAGCGAVAITLIGGWPPLLHAAGRLMALGRLAPRR
jgi:hypothetical protein